MFIQLKTLTYKNFLTVGQDPMVIPLDTSPTTIITGKNGDGKSTMIDALHFVLYNKAFRKVNRGDLVNWTNKKKCEVTLDLVSGSKQYKIVRGIAPNKFEIWEGVDGKLEQIEQDSSSNDFQKMLEYSIVKMTQETFRQIVILGSTSFTPFMRLSKPAKTSVVEDLLDIQIFTEMHTATKGRVVAMNKTYENIEGEVRLVQTKIESTAQYIERVEKVVAERIATKQSNIDRYNDSILAVKQKIDAIKEELKGTLPDDSNRDRYSSLIVKAQKQLGQLMIFESQFKSKKQSANKEKRFYEANSACSVCGQDIDEGFRHDKIHTAEDVIEKADEMLADMMSKIATEESIVRENNERLSAFSQELRAASSKEADLIRNESTITSLLSSIEDVKNQEETVDTSKEKSEMVVAVDKLAVLLADLKEVEKKKIRLSFVAELLKGGEIRKEIVAKYLPVLNMKIAEYLDIMEFPIQFLFNEDFEESISVGSKTGVGYNSLSEGQKMRCDLAVLFAFRDIAELKNSTSCNLLIFDEVADSSLDENGQESFKRIILEATIKGSNIFLISHNSDTISDDSFSSSIHFKRVSGFTVAE